VSLRLDLAQGLPDVLGDRVQLLQVILNLMRNAIEAMSADRRSILGVRSQVDESGDLLVSVEDSGTGIDKENLTRIFEPLFTTKQQGLGIGLSICKSIIESHHGDLSVTSVVGEGSTFYVKLPRADRRQLGTGRE
jgi:signal transduction histidine kinase